MEHIKNTILVTGATGFTGSYVLFELLKRQNNPIRAIKRKNSSTKETELIFKYLYGKEGIKENLFARIQWIEADICDVSSLEEAFEGVTEVYHCAALVSYKRSNQDLLMKTNIGGTANLVNLSIEKNIKRFAYISSIAALSRSVGMTDETMASEEPTFSSNYSKSKFFAEMEVWRGISEGLPAVIINPGVILGYGNFSKGSAKLFSTVYKGLIFYPSGTNGYVNVEDVARTLVLLAQDETTYGKRYVLVSENISYKSLFDLIANSLKVNPPTVNAGLSLSYMYWLYSELSSLFSTKEPMITKEMAETANKLYTYNNELIRKTLNYDFISLEQTIQEVSKAFLNEQTHQ